MRKHDKRFVKAIMSVVLVAGTLGLFRNVAMAAGDVKINETNFPDENFRAYIKEECDLDDNGILSSVEIAKVTFIDCSGTAEKNGGITSIKGVEYFTELDELYFAYNKVSKVDVSKNVCLTRLDCSYNQLKSIDVSMITPLVAFWCNGNQLRNLDVSKNKDLARLECYDNSLTRLDVSRNEHLMTLVTKGQKKTKENIKVVNFKVTTEYDENVWSYESNEYVGALYVDKVVELITKVLPLADCNGDGTVDRKDRMYLARAIADWQGYALPPIVIGDLTKDGIVDRRDRMYLARALARWDGYSVK